MSTGSWPPSPNAAYIKTEGITTVSWGTEGVFGTYIVKSVKFTQRNEEYDVENGSGLEAVVFLIKKGEDLELTVVEDSAQTPPVSGDILTFNTPFTSNLRLWCMNADVDGARKTESNRVIRAKSFNAITLS